MSTNIERMTITLTSEMAHTVKDAVHCGAYASSSEVIREALRDWRYKRMMQERQLGELRADVQAGVDDLAVGRVQDFDADRIIEKGRQLRSAPSSSE